MSTPHSFVVVGAGNRGSGYAHFAVEHPDRMTVVGVAEPDEYRRAGMQQLHRMPRENVFSDWQQLADRPRMADAAIITTSDALHTEPAIALARKGYHLLLEKPMAPTAEECVRIVNEVNRADVMFAVCHVLRYTPYTRALKQIVDSGKIGEIVNMQHLEPVGYWHIAHSFVRGNWRNEAESSFMLLAKSCHDLDWMRYLMSEKCLSVSSFGNRTHFRSENKPEGAGSRCTSCAVESNCPYSAVKIYMDRLREGGSGWPTAMVVPEPTEASVMAALETSPYGRCVYECDNDVVDNQSVIMEFENRKTADFSMTGFTPFRPSRQSQIFGSHGHLYGDSSVIRHYDYLSDELREIDTNASEASVAGGHGGGDAGLMESFLRALETGDRSHILSGPEETLESHLMVFAAERARRERRVVDMKEFAAIQAMGVYR
jgi:predicted dehydrogenase